MQNGQRLLARSEALMVPLYRERLNVGSAGTTPYSRQPGPRSDSAPRSGRRRKSFPKWGGQASNLRPTDYESAALTN